MKYRIKNWALVSFCIVSLHAYRADAVSSTIPDSTKALLKFCKKTNQYHTLNSRFNVNGRGKKEYGMLLGTEFLEHRRTLQPGDLIIDSGGGLGIYALQTADEFGSKSVVINLNDAWKELDSIPTQFLDFAIAHPEAARLVFRNFEPLADSVGYHLGWGLREPKDPEEYALHKSAQLEWMKIKAKTFREKVESKGLFEYRIGASEKILEKYSGQAKEVTSVVADFFYSPARLKLLELYYQALAPHGKAFIYIGADHVHGLHHDIVSVKQPPKSLYSYLVARYPTIFHFTPGAHNSEFDKYKRDAALVMEKDPAIPRIAIPLTPQFVRIFEDPFHGLQIPIVHYRTR